MKDIRKIIGTGSNCSSSMGADYGSADCWLRLHAARLRQVLLKALKPSPPSCMQSAYPLLTSWLGYHPD
jgi:hypothetical protein